MIAFIKYPIPETKFIELDKIEKKDGYIVVFPKTSVNEKGTVIYPKENKIGFYCKSLALGSILYFKGGFNIEKCTIKERIIQARKWYKETNQNLPRKTKKTLLGTKYSLRD